MPKLDNLENKMKEQEKETAELKVKIQKAFVMLLYERFPLYMAAKMKEAIANASPRSSYNFDLASIWLTFLSEDITFDDLDNETITPRDLYLNYQNHVLGKETSNLDRSDPWFYMFFYEEDDGKDSNLGLTKLFINYKVNKYNQVPGKKSIFNLLKEVGSSSWNITISQSDYFKTILKTLKEDLGLMGLALKDAIVQASFKAKNLRFVHDDTIKVRYMPSMPGIGTYGDNVFNKDNEQECLLSYKESIINKPTFNIVSDLTIYDSYFYIDPLYLVVVKK